MKARTTGRGARWLLLLFLLPVVALLYPPFYDLTDPRLLGVPFFYWFQLAWIFVTAGLTLVTFLGKVHTENEGSGS